VGARAVVTLRPAEQQPRILVMPREDGDLVLAGERLGEVSAVL
jgi:hypothetical protein